MSDRIVVGIDAALAELIPGYLQNRREDLGAIEAALAQGDFDTIRFLGHSMKGSGGGYGFTAITAFGTELERAAMAADADEIRRWARELAAYCERVEVVYE